MVLFQNNVSSGFRAVEANMEIFFIEKRYAKQQAFIQQASILK